MRVVFFSLILMLLAPAWSPGLTLRFDGPASKPVATIVIPGSVGPHRRQTAELLQHYVELCTGARLPIARRAGDGLAIHVGRSEYVARQGLALETMDDDGFVLKGIDARNYVIAGPTEYGTEFGVCEFIERNLSVRWLLPGKDGVDAPKRATLSISPAEVRQEPAFRSRRVSGLVNVTQQTWAKRLRMHGRVKFHHNLYRLLPPSRYARSHPEFYAVRDGKRIVPTSDRDQQWQPDFSQTASADEAARLIRRHFRAHPDETSYSLGINDSKIPVEPGAAVRVNYLGLADASDAYFRWCNRVVEGVVAEFPDKWFGCLAYLNLAEPPTDVRIHPRIVPFMTYDRMQWADAGKRSANQDLTVRWQAATGAVGWYDYIYGSPYCVPRVYPHLMAEYLRFGRDHGVGSYYAEAYPNWGEGPKLYVLFKLLWNPDLDVDALLAEWYTRCVGADAAPLLREYYEIWERFWTKTIPRTKWFADSRQYLLFREPDYLAAVDPEDIKRSRELLDGVLDKAKTERQRARAKLLRDAFEYYEASVVSYRSSAVVRRQALTTEREAVAALEDAVRRFEAKQRRIDYVARSETDPLLRMPIGWDRYPHLRGDEWDAGLCWPLIDWIARSDLVRARVTALKGHRLPGVRFRTEVLLRAAAGNLEPFRVSRDPSFEDDEPTAWKLWVKRGIGSVRRTDVVARTGRSSIECAGVSRGGPHQSIPVTPGRYLAMGYVHAPAGQSPSGTVTITSVMRGPKNQNLRTPATMVDVSPGMWKPVGCLIDVPREVEGTPVVRMMLIATCDGFRKDDHVYIDDLALYRLPGDW